LTAKDTDHLFLAIYYSAVEEETNLQIVWKKSMIMSVLSFPIASECQSMNKLHGRLVAIYSVRNTRSLLRKPGTENENGSDCC